MKHDETRNRQAKVDVEPNATSLIIKALKEPLRDTWLAVQLVPRQNPDDAPDSGQVWEW